MAMKKIFLFNFNYQLTKKSENLFPLFFASINKQHTRKESSLGDKKYLIDYLTKMSNKKNLKIAVEGNIASGKSSIIRYLQNRFDVKSGESNEKKILINNNINIENITATDNYKSYKEIDVANCTIELNEEEKENKLNGLNLGSATAAAAVGDIGRLNVNLKVIQEPVQLWRNLNGANLLELMYCDPLRWAYPFHSYVQLTMLQNHMELAANTAQTSLNERFIGIMERSLFSAKYCFAENLYKKNLLTKVEYEILDRWFNWMIENHDCELDLIFYLRTKPETCLKRLHNRGRAEEIDRISLEYLKSLHALHESWLVNSEYVASGEDGVARAPLYKPPSVIVIDADQPIDEVYKTIEIETRKAVRIVSC